MSKAPKSVIQCQLKLRLTCAQEAQLRRWLWHLTAVYNWTLKTVQRELDSGRTPSAIDLKTRINGHSRRLGIPVSALRGTIDTAHDAWVRCFKGLAGRPKLKGRRRPLNTIALSDGIASWRGTRPAVPGIGPLRCHKQEIPAGHIGFARVIRRASGWYLCLFVQSDPKPIARVADAEIGIDPGFKSLLALSTGEVIDIPSELATGARRLAQSQRGRRRRLTARLNERTANQRKNRNHHLSRQLVSENRLIAFSKDRTAFIARRFGKSVASSGHTQLRSMLTYKSLIGGTEYIEVDPRNSTRTCSACGALTGPTGFAGLRVRQWRCGCGADHERDVNAAQNTLIAGLGISHERGRKAASGTASHQHRGVQQERGRRI